MGEKDGVSRLHGVFIALVLGLLAAYGLAVYSTANDGSTLRVHSDAAPGFREPRQTQDSTPFEMFEPRQSGSTTIPGGPAEVGPESPESTTTTIKPLVTVESSDKACLAAKQIADMFRDPVYLSSPPSYLARYIAGQLSQAAGHLRESGNPEYDDAIAGLDVAVLKLTSATDQTQIDEAIAPILSPTGPVPDGPTAAIVRHVRTYCKGLLP